MNKRLIIAVGLLLVLIVAGFSGCAGKKETAVKQTVEVVRGDLVVTVNADGNLDMPHEAKLRFGAPGTVKGIYVKEGNRVREGALLAKFYDTAQKLAVQQAQYNVELAMNELVEKIHPALMGYPKLYPDPNAALRLEQAKKELTQARKLLGQGKYQDAVTELRLAQHDLAACYYLIDLPDIRAVSTEQDELGNTIEKYPQIPQALGMLKQDMGRVVYIQQLMGEGQYDQASSAFSATLQALDDTYNVVKSVSGRIRMSQRLGACCGQATTQSQAFVPNPSYSPSPYILVDHPHDFEYRALVPNPNYDPNPYFVSFQFSDTGLMPISYPDTSTSLSFLKQVEEGLQKIQACKKDESCEAQELATLIRLAQHDVDMSRTILEDNELIFRSGMNLKASRGLSLNLQLADIALKNAKDALMKTEILAPFDGTVVYIGVKEDDQLSAFDYSSRVAVHLVDTRTVEMKGTVDEVDIYKVKEGQEVIVAVDALPAVPLKGKLTFISPFGTQQAGILNFAVTIMLEPTEVELKGGLTATGDIIVDKRENVLLIPNRAVKGLPGEQWVEVMVDEAKKVTEKRPIKIGLQNERFSEVIEGLKEDEKVVVDAGARTSK
ncbi:MAG: efflux RND transporter periplasmic adaptor subunit [Chloroflexi bacterium]|nr:efflux RND transporter periplasmic adaptor subunit [Chloroflexota bacterium]